MRRKPKGSKYRNLTARGDVIYYQRVVSGQRLYRSLRTADWERAVARRDLYEERKGIGRGDFKPVRMPTFSEFTQRYLTEDTRTLAPTTLLLRTRELRADSKGGLLEFFGSLHLDEITKAKLREWWTLQIDGKGRSLKSGRNYLGALSAVLRYARELDLIDVDVVGEFRELVLKRMGRSQRGRAEATEKQQPIEDPAHVHALVRSACEEGPEEYAFVLLLLDAGLRLGEARGLRWSRIVWGEHAEDTSRLLVIDWNIPNQGPPGPPKSGRPRRVALSLRLRDALAALLRLRPGRPNREDLVFPDLDHQAFRRAQWDRIVRRAAIGHVRMKDLRDTFASHLLTAGVQLGYVSRQLGHADVAVTSRHYARWAGGDEFRPPIPLKPGEVPADLLARLPESHHVHITSLGLAEGDGADTDVST